MNEPTAAERRDAALSNPIAATVDPIAADVAAALRLAVARGGLPFDPADMHASDNLHALAVTIWNGGILSDAVTAAFPPITHGTASSRERFAAIRGRIAARAIDLAVYAGPRPDMADFYAAEYRRHPEHADQIRPRLAASLRRTAPDLSDTGLALALAVYCAGHADHDLIMNAVTAVRMTQCDDCGKYRHPAAPADAMCWRATEKLTVSRDGAVRGTGHRQPLGTVTRTGRGRWITSATGERAVFATRAAAVRSLRLEAGERAAAVELAAAMRAAAVEGRNPDGVVADALDAALDWYTRAGVAVDPAAVAALAFAYWTTTPVFDIRPEGGAAAAELAAASRQGLDPMMHMLTRAGRAYWLWQSGGMCMVLMVNLASGAKIAVTADDPWFAAYQPYGVDTDVEEELVLGNLTDAQVMDAIAMYDNTPVPARGTFTEADRVG